MRICLGLFTDKTQLDDHVKGREQEKREKEEKERNEMLTTELKNLKTTDNLTNKALNSVDVSRVGRCLGRHEFKLFVLKF